MSRPWFPHPLRLTLVLALALAGACRPTPPPAAETPPGPEQSLPSARARGMDGAPPTNGAEPGAQASSAIPEPKALVPSPPPPLPHPSLLNLPFPDPQRLTQGVLSVPWGRGVKAQGAFGVVSSVEAHATRAGIEVLSRGG